MKQAVIRFCLVLLLGYMLVALLNLPILNVGLLKFRGVCRSCDLTNANLEAMNLQGVDLYSATLTGANLSGADLSGAYLIGADLEGAFLQGADLSYADLTDAWCWGAFFVAAWLGGTIFDGADLTYAYFDENEDQYDDVSYDAGYIDGAESGDLNLDGFDNVLDVVILVDNILNP